MLTVSGIKHVPQPRLGRHEAEQSSLSLGMAAAGAGTPRRPWDSCSHPEHEAKALPTPRHTALLGKGREAWAGERQCAGREARVMFLAGQRCARGLVLITGS